MRDANRKEDIHHYGDGRGVRLCYLNGKMLDSVLWADVRRGIVVIARKPIRLDKHWKRVLKQRLRGRVEIVFPSS